MWNDKLWLSLGTVSPFLFNFLAFSHCTRPFYPWRDEILESKLNPGVKGKDASYYCFNVMYWYFGAKRTQKQLRRCCRSSWQTNKSLAVQLSCTLCPKPIHPSFYSLFFFGFESNMHPLKLHPEGPHVSSQSAWLLKRRSKDISPQQLCCSCKHLHTLEEKQVLLPVFIANLQYTVNLKPLILSVSSWFHHIFAELFISFFFKKKKTTHGSWTSFAMETNHVCKGMWNKLLIDRNLGEERQKTCFVFSAVLAGWSVVHRVLWGPDWGWFALSEYVSLPPQWRWHAPRSRFTPDLWAASVKARHCSGLFETHTHTHTLEFSSQFNVSEIKSCDQTRDDLNVERRHLTLFWSFANMIQTKT